jgi:IS30 family transposase
VSRAERKPWTTGEQKRLREMRAAGASIPRCAAALDRTRGSVSGQLVRMGLAKQAPAFRRRPGELYEAVRRLKRQKVGASEMADRLGVARCTVYATLKRIP